MSQINTQFSNRNIVNILESERNKQRQIRTSYRNKHIQRGSNIMKSLDFIQRIKDKDKNKQKQKYAIKAINIVNSNNSNFKNKQLIDEPEITNFIIQTMKKYNKQNTNNNNNNSKVSHNNSYNNINNINNINTNNNNNNNSNQNSANNSLLMSSKSSPRTSYKQNNIHQTQKSYRVVDPQRRNILKLNSWLNQKIKQQKQSQKNNHTLIIQRIYSLQLAFSQICKYTGKYSQQLAQTLMNIHSEYHQMYNKLIDIFMHQNLQIKNKNMENQDKIKNIVIHYQKQLLNIRQQYDKKSGKVIQNFNKCIQMKNQLQQDVKKLTKQLKNEKVKLNFMQQGLAKSIHILLQIGEQKFKFLTAQQQRVILSISNQYKKSPSNYKLFHKWCSTLLKIIANMKQTSKQQKKQANTNNINNDKQKQENIKYLKKFALSAIGKFMIDFDPSLSIRDAEQVLLNFMTYHSNIDINMQQKLGENQNNQLQPKIKLPQENSINIFQYQQKYSKLQQNNNSQLFLLKVPKIEASRIKSGKKRLQTPSVPNLHEISEKFKGINVQIQVNTTIQYQCAATQTIVQKVDCYVTAKPRQKTKQTSTLIWLRDKLKITDIQDMNIFIWAQREITDKDRQNYKKIYSTQNRQQSNLKQSKKTLKQTITRKLSTIQSVAVLKSFSKGSSTTRNSNLNQNKVKNQMSSLSVSRIDKSDTIINEANQLNQLQQEVQNNEKQQKIPKIQLKTTALKKSDSKKSVSKQKKRTGLINKRQNFTSLSSPNSPRNKKVVFGKQQDQQQQKLQQKQRSLNASKQLINMTMDAIVQNDESKIQTMKSNTQRKFLQPSIKKIPNTQKSKKLIQQPMKYKQHKKRNVNFSEQKITFIDNKNQCSVDQNQISLEDNKNKNKQLCTEKQIKVQSKSLGFIRSSNQSNNYSPLQELRRLGLIPKDGDQDIQLYVQQILERRKAERQRMIQKQKQKINQSNNNNDTNLNDKQKIKQKIKAEQKAKLNIHGKHISINKFDFSFSFKNLRSQSTKNIQQNNSNHKKQILLDLIKSSKKIQKMESIDIVPQLNTNSHEFLLQYVGNLQQKNKKITLSTMWGHKKTIQIQRTIIKLKSNKTKQRMIPTQNNIQSVQNFIVKNIQPIIASYLKMYKILAQQENALTSQQFKYQLMSGKKLTYYHRLSPLFHSIINMVSLNSYGMGKCTNLISVFYKGMKSLKTYDKKLQIIDQLIENGNIQMDIFIKILHNLSIKKNINLQGQFVMISILEVQIHFILSMYLNLQQINNLISQIKNNKRQVIPNSQTHSFTKTHKKNNSQTSNNMNVSKIMNHDENKINLHILTMKIFKTISQKKFTLLKKYKSILQILAGQNQQIIYDDLYYFIQALPIDKQTRKKIIYHSSFYLVYWNKKQATISQDILVFLFQSLRFIPTQAIQKDIIFQFFRIKCQNEYKQFYQQLISNTDNILNSIYKKLQRNSPMIYRLAQDIKTNKNVKRNTYILTVLYNMMMEDQLEKQYMSGYLNVLSALPFLY